MFLPALLGTLLPSTLILTDAPPEVYYPPVQQLDLEGAEVRATLNGPQVQPVFEVGKMAFAPLIRLRANFDEELEQSVPEVR
jgi:hypothetical protein